MFPALRIYTADTLFKSHRKNELLSVNLMHVQYRQILPDILYKKLTLRSEPFPSIDGKPLCFCNSVLVKNPFDM
jgi:hypothetical protein